MIRTNLKSAALIAAAFSAIFAFSPNEAQAGRTGYFIGGVAAAIGGAVLIDAVSRSGGRYGRHGRYDRRHYAPRQYYRPARSCRSTRSTLRKLSRRHGFHGFHNLRYRQNGIKMRAWKYGELFKLKTNRCSGRLIWSRTI